MLEKSKTLMAAGAHLAASDSRYQISFSLHLYRGIATMYVEEI